MEDTPPPDQDRSDQQAPTEPSQGGYHKGLAAGYTLAGGLVVGLGIGYAIDAAAGTKPLWTVCGAILFMLAGLYQVVKDSLR